MVSEQRFFSGSSSSSFSCHLQIAANQTQALGQLLSLFLFPFPFLSINKHRNSKHSIPKFLALAHCVLFPISKFLETAAMTSSAAPSSVSMPSVPTTPIYHFVTVKLNDDNFLLWSHQIESYLHGNKLFKFVDGSFPCPATSTSDHEKHNLELTGNGTCAKKSLKMIQSELEAQNIENLDLTELTQLEKQLDAILRQTRSRKTQLMTETITSLIEKGKKLGEEKDLMEKEIAALMVEKANQPEQPTAIAAANDNHDDEEMEGEREGEADEHSSCAHTKHPVLNLF